MAGGTERVIIPPATPPSDRPGEPFTPSQPTPPPQPQPSPSPEREPDPEPGN